MLLFLKLELLWTSHFCLFLHAVCVSNYHAIWLLLSVSNYMNLLYQGHDISCLCLKLVWCWSTINNGIDTANALLFIPNFPGQISHIYVCFADWLILLTDDISWPRFFLTNTVVHVPLILNDELGWYVAWYCWTNCLLNPAAI